MIGCKDTIPLVFHYTGATLPDYAAYSLKKASRTWPNEIFLIHDRPVRFQNDRVAVSNPADWYDPGDFEVWSARTEMPRDFRQGFWHHAVERFFMLDQWSRSMKRPRFLHCELDVALYRMSELERVLEGLRPAVYYPRASLTHAGANWLFSSSPKSFRRLVDFLAENSGSTYEMALLARFLDEFPLDAVAAPSHYTLERIEDGDKAALKSLETWGGLIDVHPLGTWLLGDDPRNTNAGPIFNRTYYKDVGSSFLGMLNFQFDPNNRGLVVASSTVRGLPVFALHVHSKKMRTGYLPAILRLHVLFLRLPFRVPLALRGVRSWLLLGMMSLVDRAYLIQKRLLSSWRTFFTSNS